ncbi:hypothetical protein [Hymenobacter psychrophilus]|uniref:DUF4349 domain-containing protein n=1 Tax=Hymenobacter psychrophilus TaxID=651662 RepID=A0A1H3BMN5_9BACT|nr:hypothetical protein [Hymenobacter psychrophilus]SDX43055.1 hypothetical protein SAMN04488069_101349 [Hymenobacter psychrophilus]
MPRFRPLPLLLLLLGLVLPLLVAAQTTTGPAAANKRLFDRTVDELNFRTMETVYDKSFTRAKYPVSLRSPKARAEFSNYFGRADLQQLFRNYNGVSERFKGQFGKGRTDLLEFEKQLNSTLVDRNFEFFIRVLPRDERVALVRTLQRVIKQSAAQFNASQDPAPDEVAADGAAVPPAADGVAPATLSGPATVAEDPQPQPEADLASSPAYAGPRSLDVPARHDWMDYLNLMLLSGSFLLLLYLVLSVVPALQQRLDAVAPPSYPDSDDETEPLPQRPRRTTSRALPEDRYEEEDN